MYEKELENFKRYMMRKRYREGTISTYLQHFGQFIKVTGKNPRKVNKNDIKAYEDYCVKFGNNSLIPKYSAVNKYLEYLVDEGVITEDDKKRIKLTLPQTQEKLINALTREQVEQILNKAEERNVRDLAMFLSAYNGGLRRREVTNLNLDDIDFDRRALKILDTKRGKSRIVKVSARCIDALQDYITNYRETPKRGYEKALFLNRGLRLSRSKYHLLHKEYKYLCGLPEKVDFYPHIWRHTGLTHYAHGLLKRGKGEAITIKALKEQSGISDVNVLMKYLHMPEEESRDIFDSTFDKPEPKPLPKSQEPKPEVKKQEPQDTYIAKPKEPESSNDDLRNLLLQRFVKGEISENVYLLTLKQLDITNKTIDGYQ